MNRMLVLLAPIALAACGTDTCTSAPAPLASGNANPSCSVGATQTVTFSVGLNCKCTDSAPSCQAEFVNGGFEVSPVFQQCQESAGCSTAGCPLGQPTATCIATAPAGVSGQVPLTIVSDTVLSGGTVNVGGGSGTTCNL